MSPLLMNREPPGQSQYNQLCPIEIKGFEDPVDPGKQQWMAESSDLGLPFPCQIPPRAHIPLVPVLLAHDTLETLGWTSSQSERQKHI